MLTPSQKALRLLTEMLFVGATLAIMGLLVGYGTDVLMRRRVKWAPPHLKSMLLGTFATGALYHLVAEVTGLNAWYVKRYEPLTR